jgi:hypothetical protein
MWETEAVPTLDHFGHHPASAEFQIFIVDFSYSVEERFKAVTLLKMWLRAIPTVP